MKCGRRRATAEPCARPSDSKLLHRLFSNRIPFPAIGTLPHPLAHGVAAILAYERRLRFGHSVTSGGSGELQNQHIDQQRERLTTDNGLRTSYSKYTRGTLAPMRVRIS